MQIYVDESCLSIKLPNKKYRDVKAHMLFISKYSNFKCIFCKFNEGYIDDSENNYYSKKFKNYTDEEMTNLIKKLMKKNKCFKFSGGEPLMNKKLEFMLEITKNSGGITFLDTNCSLYSVLTKLIDKNLIDILGVSLKGVTPDQAKFNTQVMNTDLVWNNVFNSIEYALKNSVKYVIITLVVFDFTKKNDLLLFLQRYTDLFKKYNSSNYEWGKLIFKFNNMLVYEQNQELRPVDSKLLKNTLEELVKNNSHLKGKVVLVNNGEAVHDYNSINFM